jgi:hypothetical protein
VDHADCPNCVVERSAEADDVAPHSAACALPL